MFVRLLAETYLCVQRINVIRCCLITWAEWALTWRKRTHEDGVGGKKSIDTTIQLPDLQKHFTSRSYIPRASSLTGRQPPLATDSIHVFLLIFLPLDNSPRFLSLAALASASIQTLQLLSRRLHRIFTPITPRA